MRASFASNFSAMNDIRQGIVHINRPRTRLDAPGPSPSPAGRTRIPRRMARSARSPSASARRKSSMCGDPDALHHALRHGHLRKLPIGVTAKDIILAIIARIGTGRAAPDMSSICRRYDSRAVHGRRMTVCNMSIEAGARRLDRAGRDDLRLHSREAPRAQGAAWDAAVAYWRTLKSDEGAKFDAEVKLARKTRPMVTWGTSPEQALPSRGANPIRRRKRIPTMRRHESPRSPIWIEARHALARGQDRPRLHRLLHQCPPSRIARGGEIVEHEFEKGAKSHPCRAMVCWARVW